MKKNKKITKTIAISALTALTFGSVALTTTYALFTSEANTNVTVASGKVKVSTKIDENSIKLYSLNETEDSVEVESSKTSFTSGASFSYDNENGTISLGKFMPGDKVEFTINATNDSNVNIKYRTVLKTEDNGLFQGLKVTINDVTYDGSTTISDYASLSANTDFSGNNKAYKFSIELPKEAGNERQEKDCKISFNIEAIQGNAAVTNPDQASYQIYTPLDLVAFANKINNNTSLQANEGVYKVYLMNDIDMANIKYVSPNYTMGNTQIEFIGNNKTISNFTPSESVDGSGNKFVGLFGRVGAGSAYIHDVYFNNATIIGDFTIELEPNLGGGVVVGLTDAGASNLKIENVQLNGNISVSDVKYAGGLVGYTSCETNITNCTINADSTVSIAGYTAGGLLGQNGGNTTTISGISISSDVNVDGYKREGGLVGAGSSGTTTTITFNDSNLKDHLKISNEAIAAQGTYVGLVSNTTINGDQYYTAINGNDISGITVTDKSKKTIVEIGEGEYKGYLAKFTSITGGVTVIGRGDKDKITWVQSNDTNNGSSFNGTAVTMENLTLTSDYSKNGTHSTNIDSGFYTGFPHATSTSFTDVKILVKNEAGAMGLWGETATFNNCEFYTEAEESNMFTYGGKNYTFNDCEFTSTETAIKMYQEKKETDTNIYINVNNCEFKNTRTQAFDTSKNYKSAIQVACDYADDKVCYNVVIDGKSTISGNYATGLYQGWIGARYYNHTTIANTVSSDNVKFTIDGKTPTLSWNN